MDHFLSMHKAVDSKPSTIKHIKMFQSNSQSGSAYYFSCLKIWPFLKFCRLDEEIITSRGKGDVCNGTHTWRCFRSKDPEMDTR